MATYTITTQMALLMRDLVSHHWNIPVHHVNSGKFSAFKEYQDCVVIANVDAGPVFAEVTFEWPDTVDEEKSREVMARLKSVYG